MGDRCASWGSDRGRGPSGVFAASAEAALSCGWRYAVVTGWRANAIDHDRHAVGSAASVGRPAGAAGGTAGCGRRGFAAVRGFGFWHCRAGGGACARRAPVVVAAAGYGLVPAVSWSTIPAAISPAGSRRCRRRTAAVSRRCCRICRRIGRSRWRFGWRTCWRWRPATAAVIRAAPGRVSRGPEYDPAVTTLTAAAAGEGRRTWQATAIRQHARLLGLEQVSYRTLIRLGAWPCGGSGLIGCADDRWLRRGAGAPSITEPRSGRRSSRFGRRRCTGRRISMRTRERPDPSVRAGDVRPGRGQVPCYDTLRLVWQRVVRPGRRPAALRAVGCSCRTARASMWWSHRPGPGGRAGHHGAAGEGPRDGVRRAGHGASDPRAGRLHALAGGVPAHAGVGHRRWTWRCCCGT